MKMEKPPIITTIANWYKEYEEFSAIFEFADDRELLNPLFVQPIDQQYLFLFHYLLEKQSSRTVIPPLCFNREKDIITIRKLKEAISHHAYIIYQKYDLLAQTIPTNIDDYFENYRISRQKTRGKKVKSGTIVHSGNDRMQSASDVTTSKMTTTAESPNGRLESKTITSNTPNSAVENNQVKTLYGHTITSTPGDEDITERTTAHGYYNSGTKADMIREVREVINFNIIDEWLKEMMPTFCLNYYNPEASIPHEFIVN